MRHRLFSLSDAQLDAEARNRSIPKWSTLCLLRLLHLPTLDSVLMEPGQDRLSVLRAIEAFAAAIERDSVALRTDGGREATDYIRAGNTLPIPDAAKLASAQLDRGRYVILTEPTNRFGNLSSFNVRLERQGQFFMETLGPGYDSADLNRGGIPPEYLISGFFRSWTAFEELGPLDFRIDCPPIAEKQRRQTRLEVIGLTILPALGHRVARNPARAAEFWLLSNGYTALWTDRPPLNLATIIQTMGDAFIVANWHSANLPGWAVLSLSGAQLANRRTIYWDVVDAGLKWLLSNSFMGSGHHPPQLSPQGTRP